MILFFSLAPIYSNPIIQKIYAHKNMPYATQTHTKGIHNTHDLPVTMTKTTTSIAKFKSKGKEPSRFLPRLTSF